MVSRIEHPACSTALLPMGVDRTMVRHITSNTASLQIKTLQLLVNFVSKGMCRLDPCLDSSFLRTHVKCGRPSLHDQELSARPIYKLSRGIFACKSTERCLQMVDAMSTGKPGCTAAAAATTGSPDTETKQQQLVVNSETSQAVISYNSSANMYPRAFGSTSTSLPSYSNPETPFRACYTPGATVAADGLQRLQLAPHTPQS